MITRAGLEAAHWTETVHGHGARGMYLYGYVCREHPRLTCEIRRTARDRSGRRALETKTFFVDEHECADLEAALAALDGPHDLEGIADRLAARLINKTVEFTGGKLIVTGETERRIARLNQTMPSFEGVPIEWRP